jgi:hypothetical protein
MHVRFSSDTTRLVIKYSVLHATIKYLSSDGMSSFHVLFVVGFHVLFVIVV